MADESWLAIVVLSTDGSALLEPKTEEIYSRRGQIAPRTGQIAPRLIRRLRGRSALKARWGAW